jgi:uncharacterized membrane protein YbhN (UPF0104 family)
LTDESETQAISLKRRFLSPQTAISFLALGGVLALLLTRFDIAWGQTWDLMRGMNLGWFALAIAVHYTTFYFRGARWRMLLARTLRDAMARSSCRATRCTTAGSS